MRRIVAAAAIAATTGAHPVAAQEPVFGVKGGLNGASISVSGTEHFDTTANVGAALGAFIGFGIGAGSRIQPEVLFTINRFSSSDFPLTLTVNTRAVEVPVLILKRFQTGRRVQPMLFAGPQLTFLAKTTQTFGSTKSDVTSELERTDVGIAAGGGVEVSADHGAMTMEARFAVGFRDLSRSNLSSTHSRAFMGLVGYRF